MDLARTDVIEVGDRDGSIADLAGVDLVDGQVALCESDGADGDVHTAAVDRGPDVDGGIEVAVALEDLLVELLGLFAVSDPQVKRADIEAVVDNVPTRLVDRIVDVVTELIQRALDILIGRGDGHAEVTEIGLERVGDVLTPPPERDELVIVELAAGGHVLASAGLLVVEFGARHVVEGLDRLPGACIRVVAAGQGIRKARAVRDEAAVALGHREQRVTARIVVFEHEMVQLVVHVGSPNG